MMGNGSNYLMILLGLIQEKISDGTQRPTQEGTFSSAQMKLAALGHTGMDLLGRVQELGWK